MHPNKKTTNKNQNQNFSKTVPKLVLVGIVSVYEKKNTIGDKITIKRNITKKSSSS